MLELAFGIVGILALIGSCVLLYLAGSLSMRAVEVHSEIHKMVETLRESQRNDYKQIQEWITEVNIAVEEGGLKQVALQEVCINNFGAIEKEVQSIKRNIKEMTVMTTDPSKLPN